MKNKILILVLWGLAHFAPATAADAPNATREAAALIERMNDSSAPGGVVGILDLQKHQWLLQKAFGLANVDTGKRNGVDTIFCVASVSKQFTATLAAIAAH
ncbi:serine hydrolase, partial [Steroidobacter sp.]|uniref:serine hydrolase n=1 Tax=Steroidobacter sp. TaxID=1978227 RepID=UPI001A5283AB